MPNFVHRLQRRFSIAWHYLKGEWWCRKRHAPFFTELGGYGGTDWLGRRQQEYHGCWCVVCNNRWEKAGSPKPLTPEQEIACAEAFGDMWTGKGCK
jgi:hypothetical protein